jgi:hypothetical protein
MTSRDGQQVGGLDSLGHWDLERAFGPFARLALVAILVPTAKGADREIADNAVRAHRHSLPRKSVWTIKIKIEETYKGAAVSQTSHEGQIGDVKTWDFIL